MEVLVRLRPGGGDVVFAVAALISPGMSLKGYHTDVDIRLRFCIGNPMK